MRQCIFASCKSRPDDRIGNVALVHRFPREEHIRKQWVQWVQEKCDMPTFEVNPKAVLCYRHFDRRCYHRSNGLLKPFSYPTYTPRDLDNMSKFGTSTQLLSMNGAPRTSLIIKVDPSLVKYSPSEKTNPEKKLVLLVTDKGMPISQPPQSTVSFINPADAGVNLIRSQDVPPLRFYGRGRPSTEPVSEAIPSNQDTSVPITNIFCAAQSQLPTDATCLSPAANTFKNGDNVLLSRNSISSPCAVEQQRLSQRETGFSSSPGEDSSSRSSRTVNLIQTVLNSSRSRVRVYRRRIQQERKKMSRLEDLLEEMKKEQLISVAVAEKFEAILFDD